MSKPPETTVLSADHISGIIEMALSDHVSFDDIKTEYGVSDKDVKKPYATQIEKRQLQGMAQACSQFRGSQRYL